MLISTLFVNKQIKADEIYRFLFSSVLMKNKSKMHMKYMY